MQDDLSAIDSHNKDGTPVSNKATLTGKLLGLGDKLPLAFGKGGGLDEDESENPGVGQPRERGVRQFADQAENIGAKEMVSSLAPVYFVCVCHCILLCIAKCAHVINILLFHRNSHLLGCMSLAFCLHNLF